MSQADDGTPEIVDPLDLPERPFTVRNLADYRQCPQKFLLSQFVSREETRRFLGGPATLHQALRRALVQCYRRGGPMETPFDTMLGAFEEEWDGSACADSLEEERLHAQGVKLLREYHEAHREPFPQAIEVDLRMEIELEDHTFVAVADALMREEGGDINALRWLSTRKPPSVREIFESPGWGLLFKCAQERFEGEDVSVTMYSLRRGSGHRVRFISDDLEPLMRRLTRQADRIRVATEFPPVTGMHCRWCRARSRCPALK